jgi:hypothetical protein
MTENPVIETPAKNQNKTLQIVLFSILVGTISSLWSYTFGTGNHIEQLPIVMRAMDSAFLSNDFFTNASTMFGPRLYFARLIAGLAGLAPLHTIYLGLTILSNILIALVTAFFARDQFDDSDKAAFLSAAVVMSLKTFWLGSTNTVFRTYLEPLLLISPLLLGAIWAGLRRRPLLAALLSGIASLVHSLVGLETGALILGALVVQIISQRNLKTTFNSQRRYLYTLAAGGMLFSGFAALSLVPYFSADRIEPAQFVQIMAVFRHPHHYLPSTFGMEQYAQAAAYLLAAGIALHFGQPVFLRLRSGTRVQIILYVFLTLLCIGGYLFVEVFPVRLWATAQTFRLLFIPKWLGLVMISGWVSHLFSSAGKAENKGLRWLALFSLLSLPTMAFFFTTRLGQRWLRGNNKKYSRYLIIALWTLLPVLFAANLFLLGADLRLYILFTFYTALGCGLYACKRKWLAAVSGTALAALAVTLLLRSGTPAAPAITLQDFQSDKLGVAAFVKNHTPQDAILLTPPKFGELRYTAGRAIVVDFKAFPFQDKAMVEWQQRLFDCYIEPVFTGWAAEKEMMIEYRRLTDADIIALSQQYGFTYAVLNEDMESLLPVLYEDEKYTIIQVPSGN